jgi:phosphoribosylformylglycinamidine cyclo-ligase
MTPADAYRASGVDYDVLDAAKRRAIEAAAATLSLPQSRGAEVIGESIGEPASLLVIGGLRMAVVLECLGTKSEVAREVLESLGVDRFRDVGVDAVAAIVNDLACVGALPVSLNAYFATGSGDWYGGPQAASLVDGWQAACEESGAAWVGGESPTLAGIVSPDGIDIAGSCLGVVPAGTPEWVGSRLEAGDEIVLVSSSGLHSNGASLARRVAGSLPDGWATALPSGRRLGEAVLDPSVLYVALVEELQRRASEAPVHYASHVTGHGFRKLMRAERELTYRVRALPDVPEVLEFLADRAGLSPREAYGTFNQGAGFALFVAAGGGEAVAELASGLGYGALVAGIVEPGPRSVVLEPIGVTYDSAELAVR